MCLCVVVGVGIVGCRYVLQLIGGLIVVVVVVGVVVVVVVVDLVVRAVGVVVAAHGGGGGVGCWLRVVGCCVFGCWVTFVVCSWPLLLVCLLLCFIVAPCCLPLCCYC